VVPGSLVLAVGLAIVIALARSCHTNDEDRRLARPLTSSTYVDVSENDAE
jgi:hypothetical protein